MTEEIQVLREPDQFSPRLLRLLTGFVDLAVRAGQFRQQPKGWLARVVAAREARVVMRGRSVLGFFTLKPFVDKHHGSVVYGGTCLWRTKDAQCEARVHEAVLHESTRLGTAVYGWYFANNPTAARFYSEARGWQRIGMQDFPASMHDIVADIADVTVPIRRLLADPTADAPDAG